MGWRGTLTVTNALVLLCLAGLLASSVVVVASESRFRRHAHPPSLVVHRPVPQSPDLSLNHEPAQETAAEGACECEYGPVPSPVFLGGLLSVRVFAEDKMGLTAAELVQWLQYLRFAGVQKMVVCDSFARPSESMREALAPMVAEGFVEWIDWSSHNPYDYERTQMACYRLAAARLPGAAWLLHFDIDEYPVWRPDASRDFLHRALRLLNADGKVGTLLLDNMGFLGDPDESQELLIERFSNCTTAPVNHLTKPINFMAGTAALGMHLPVTAAGYRVLRDPRLYTAHFWGARLWGFERGRMPADLRAKTRPNTDLQPMARLLRRCRRFCPRFHWIDRKPLS